MRVSARVTGIKGGGEGIAGIKGAGEGTTGIKGDGEEVKSDKGVKDEESEWWEPEIECGVVGAAS